VAFGHLVSGPDRLRGDRTSLVAYFAGSAWDGYRGSHQHAAERLVPELTARGAARS
jgi:hypothetical protein